MSIVLGDVAGHGLSAAAITAQLRHALRAHLLRAAGPAAALDGLNEVISALLPGEMATAVIAELDPATGEVVVASAGHLPVLHATAGGAEYVMDGRGPALGVLDDGALRRGAPASSPATTGCCSTATAWSSAARSGLSGGLDELRKAVAAGPVEPHALLDAVLAALNPPGTDDVTLLGVART